MLFCLGRALLVLTMGSNREAGTKYGLTSRAFPIPGHSRAVFGRLEVFQASSTWQIACWRVIVRTAERIPSLQSYGRC